MDSQINEQERAPMERISVPWILDTIAAIDSLDEVRAKLTVGDCILVLMDAKHTLEALFAFSIYKPYLRISNVKANELYETIEQLVDDDNFDIDTIITETLSWQINKQKDELRLVILSEISTLPIYLVTSKDCYDTTFLIEDGPKLFPKDILLKAPETAEDMKEVGQCLAYERNTACGFHTFRVVESVLRRYWNEVSDEEAEEPKPLTLGNIAAQLEQQGYGNDKVTEALRQMSKLHRNPIAHPEVILTGDEALGTIGMARSVITHMLSALPNIPPTTSLQLALEED